jgi:alginate O-acetyltransferase complex protein AlgI
MLVGLLACLVFAPLYWLLIPPRWRGGVLALASFAALVFYDARLAPLLAGVVLAFMLLVRGIERTSNPRARTALAAAGLAALAVLFLSNKLVGGGAGAVPSQSGLAFLGISYLVLKAAGAIIETARGTLRAVRPGEVFAWIIFLPTYPSGPMATLQHFRVQQPAFDRARVFGGLERILFGLVKALIAGHYLGEWAAPIFAAPQKFGSLSLVGAMYAGSLRFYFDFAGYSDIAIGLSAVFGYDIDENFDRPFLRRNLVDLWQHWHMTLTRWLRTYLFVPVSRRLIRMMSGRADRAAIAAGQIVAMTFCGVWHGVAANFALWGFAQALGLIWVGIVARDLGRLLPEDLVRWWRESKVAYAVSAFLTFNFFSLTMVLVLTDAGATLAYLRALFGR